MKAVTSVLSLCLLFFMGCNKDGDVTPTNDPVSNQMFFEFLKQDGSDFENNEIEIALYKSIENGEVVYNGEPLMWNSLGKVNYSNNEQALYGPLCPGDNCQNQYIGLIYGEGWENGEVKEEDNWVKEKQYLLQYPSSETDTLKIIDRLDPNFIRSFETYLNNETKEIKYVLNTEGPNTYITIQK